MTTPPPVPPIPPDALADLVASRFEPHDAAADASGCPDEGALAALAEDRLPGAEADAVAEHAVACARCLAVVEEVRGVARETPSAAAPVLDLAAARARRRRLAAAVAAAVLVALGAGLAVRALGPTRPPPAPAFEVAWARLAARAPALLAGARPLSADELSAAVAPLRGGIGLRGPGETTLSDRPSFAWDDVPGATRGTLAVVADDGREVWRRDVVGAPAAYPDDAAPLARGSAYVWTLTLDGPRGRIESSRAFRVADAATATAWAALAADADRADAVALAHAALRLGLVEEAARLADAAAARPGAAPEVAALAAHARARLAPRSR